MAANNPKICEYLIVSTLKDFLLRPHVNYVTTDKHNCAKVATQYSLSRNWEKKTQPMFKLLTQDLHLWHWLQYFWCAPQPGKCWKLYQLTKQKQSAKEKLWILNIPKLLGLTNHHHLDKFSLWPLNVSYHRATYVQSRPRTKRQNLSFFCTATWKKLKINHDP